MLKKTLGLLCDVVDPSKSIGADFSQDNGRLFKHDECCQAMCCHVIDINNTQQSKKCECMGFVILEFNFMFWKYLYTYISNSVGK